MKPPAALAETHADRADRADPDAAPTPWLAIANVVFAGIAAALHVGKATIALPLLQQEFGRSLASLSWIMSAFPFVGVFGGIAAGMLVRRWGDRRLLMLGLVVLGVSSVAGAVVRDFTWLLGTRFIEGLGFLIVVVAAPAVLNRLAPPSRRGLVFGIWSTFMGSGIALSLLLGPLVGGWRNGWLASAALALAGALLLPLTTPRDEAAGAARPAGGRALRSLRDVLTARSTLLLTFGFTAYNLQFFSLMSFLPIFLMHRLSIPVGPAGAISAAIVASNIVGNLLAGVLLSKGIRAGRLMAATSVAMGAAGAGVLLSATPAPLAVLLCFAFSAIAGMLPTTILATAPSTAPAPSLTPLSLGLVMQGNYLGQVLGPILIGTIVGAAGWPAAVFLILAAAVWGAWLGLALKVERHAA
ncbi:MFS transporter [Burkholderia alba]|uniref:MFS transporter n=1 Tax=Burkholderia alba TaxID=2683677 RepID=UPI002B0555C5|nr:MFS transporter [Burkholderia alba]